MLLKILPGSTDCLVPKPLPHFQVFVTAESHSWHQNTYYLLLHLKNHHKAQWLKMVCLKKYTNLLSHSFYGSGSWVRLDQVLWLRVYHRLQLRCQMGCILISRFNWGGTIQVVGFIQFFFFFNFYLFIYLFIGCIGSSLLCAGFLQLQRAGVTLRYSARASHCGGFSCCGARALGAWASVVVARGLQSAGSVIVAHRLSCSMACGIFPDQGSNPCPLHWQADS